MSKPFGLSVYVSTFKQQRRLLDTLKGQQIPIFTSLHIGEEVTESYVQEVEDMCQWLHRNDFYIIADVSPLTLNRFNEPSLASLVKRLHIDNVRLDFGFEEKDIVGLEGIDVTYNASTIGSDQPQQRGALYMHNFYPRPETGLDSDLFNQLNTQVKDAGGHTLAFISGDEMKRGPLNEGLPTLEAHRFMAPYAQYVDLVKTYKLDSVFVGDSLISPYQLDLILSYLTDGMIRLPVDFADEHKNLLNKPFTVRIDSPKGLIRVQESRQYAQPGEHISPAETTSRPRGTITMDNERYKRYSGEVQVMKQDYPADERVNVIGQLAKEYLPLLDNLKNGEPFIFVPAQP